MKDRSAHGGGSPEAPENESPIAEEEDVGEAEDKEGFESASEEAGGAQTVWFGLIRGFSLSFVWRIWGKGDQGAPGLTLSELGTGIGLKAEKMELPSA